MARTEVTQSAVLSGLFGQLPIPSEATTSRTVVSNSAVRVVLFAMDTGQELTDHSAPRPVVVQVLEGSLDFHVMGASHALGVGDVVYLAPDERHSLRATNPSRFVLFMDMTGPSLHTA